MQELRGRRAACRGPMHRVRRALAGLPAPCKRAERPCRRGWQGDGFCPTLLISVASTWQHS
eukprot:10075678-Lingulodinium_polyedra.AAC.1